MSTVVDWTLNDRLLRNKLLKLSNRKLIKACKFKKISYCNKKKSDIIDSLLLQKENENKLQLIPIYVPGDVTSCNEHECEYEAPPDWNKYFKNNELLDRYIVTGKIGHKSSSTFFHGKVLKHYVSKLQPETSIVIKKADSIFHSDSKMKGLLRELRILHILNGNENIIKLYDIIPPKTRDTFTSITLIYEDMDTSLRTIFETNQFFKTLHIKYILYQILLGIKYIHSNGFIHKNIKPQHILINKNCSVKICDFSLAVGINEIPVQSPKSQKKQQPHPQQKRSQIRNKKRRRLRRSVRRSKHTADHWYQAPEELLFGQGNGISTKVDIWSIGTVFGELLQMVRDNRPDPSKRGPLFPGDLFLGGDNACFNQIQLIFDFIGSPTKSEIATINDPKMRKCLDNLPQKRKKSWSRFYPAFHAKANELDLLSKMLQFDANNRMGVDEALNHPYLKDVASKRLKHKKSNNGQFAFESGALNEMQFRELIMVEVIKKHFGFISGYIRSYIKPLLDNDIIIPLDIINICYKYC